MALPAEVEITLVSETVGTVTVELRTNPFSVTAALPLSEIVEEAVAVVIVMSDTVVMETVGGVAFMVVKDMTEPYPGPFPFTAYAL